MRPANPQASESPNSASLGLMPHALKCASPEAGNRGAAFSRLRAIRWRPVRQFAIRRSGEAEAIPHRTPARAIGASRAELQVLHIRRRSCRDMLQQARREYNSNLQTQFLGLFIPPEFQRLQSESGRPAGSFPIVARRRFQNRHVLLAGFSDDFNDARGMLPGNPIGDAASSG